MIFKFFLIFCCFVIIYFCIFVLAQHTFSTYKISWRSLVGRLYSVFTVSLPMRCV
nr:MAG TPA: hypothetical protein [Caudoviricetes sp.]